MNEGSLDASWRERIVRPAGVFMSLLAITVAVMVSLGTSGPAEVGPADVGPADVGCPDVGSARPGVGVDPALDRDRDRVAALAETHAESAPRNARRGAPELAHDAKLGKLEEKVGRPALVAEAMRFADPTTDDEPADAGSPRLSCALARTHRPRGPPQA